MMNAAMMCRLTLLVLAVMLSGCGTLVLPQRPAGGDSSGADSTDARRRAEALAQYSMALLESETGDAEAVVQRYRAAISNDPGNVNLRFDLAMLLVHQARYEEFDELVDAMLADDPGFVRALRLKSFGLRLRGQLREAVEPVEASIKLEPKELTHYVEAASLYNRLGDTLAATEILERSVHAVTNRQQAFISLAYAYIEQAKQARKNNGPLTESSLELIKMATADYPDDAALLTLYGDLLVQHEQIREALDVFARVEAMAPDDPAIQQRLAVSLVLLGDDNRAIELLQEAVKHQPSNYRLWIYLGEFYQRTDDVDNAIANYQKAVEARPDLAETHLKLAHALILNKQEDRGFATLNEAREQHPEDHRLAELLAYASLRESKFDAAVAAFDDADRLIRKQDSKPILKTFHSSAAIAHQMHGSTNETIRYLNEGMAINPSSINEYLQFALRSREKSRRLQVCVDILSAVSARIPRESSTRIMMGLVTMKAGRYSEAVGHFMDAESLARAGGEDQLLDAQFYFWLASAHERNKDYDRAEEIFLSIIEKEPDHADALNYVAYMNAERGVKLEAALDQVEVALAMEPENPAYIDTRGWIYFKLGAYSNALEDISFAAEKIPDDPVIADHLGDIHLALGHEEEAVAWWKKSNAKDPSNELVREKLIARGHPVADVAVTNMEDEEEPAGEPEEIHIAVEDESGTDQEDVDAPRPENGEPPAMMDEELE